jgi:lipopolysaccharide export system protein LptC
VSLSSLDAQSNSIVMDKPHISGFEGTRRAYEVKADSAVQSLDDPKVMTFKAIDASVGLDAAGTATIDAATGVYDGNANTLVLKDGIAIKTTTGYWASFKEAAIDLAAGSLVSSQPIEIRTNEGTIRANSVEVSERGKRIAFRNGVSVTYLPPGELAAAAEDR